MNRALAALAAALSLLTGCPLPQPLADYPKGTVTPPRILMDSIAYPDPVVAVPAGCTVTAPSYDLTGTLVDSNTSETVVVRWFVDYDRQNSARCAPVVPETPIQGPGDSSSSPTQRAVHPPYHFAPYDHEAVVGTVGTPDAVGAIHVVEMVVSNNFDTGVDDVALCNPDTPATTFPFRTPATSGGVTFETQTYRWVFVNVEPSAAVPCP
ncbi:MAG TPA: hypothetical protein VMU15_18910 [Anaeromyxobacter sp.]|nr:hypothetical protein [Anaeromyxobacter sp.]